MPDVRQHRGKEQGARARLLAIIHGHIDHD